MNTDKLKMWLNRLISYYRREEANLSSEEQFYLVYNLDPPCQVHVLWASNNQPQSDYQVLIFTHFSLQPDLTFNIFGPFEPYRFAEFAVQMLQDSQWDKPLPQNEYDIFRETGMRTYRDLLVGILRGFNRGNERYFTQRALLSKDFPNGLIASKQSLYYETKDFLWEEWGDIAELDPEKLVREDIDDACAAYNRLRKDTGLYKPANAKQSRPLSNYGALLFPPVWVGEQPTQSLEDEVKGKHIRPRIVLNADYQGSKIFLRQDGFLAVRLPDNITKLNRKNRCLEMINEIIASLFLLDVPLEATRENDIIEVNIGTEPHIFGSMSWSPERMRKPFDGDTLWGLVSPPSTPFDSNRINVPEERLNRALRLSGNIAKDSILKNLTAFILEAHTLFKNGEYSQSLLSSWLVFETNIESLWSYYLSSQDLNNRRMTKFNDKNRWSMDYIIETLSLMGKLNKKDYDYLTKLKTIRNKVVHSGLVVTEAEAQQSLELATKLVRDACKID